MANQNVRIEEDSMGKIEVPNSALYGAQTQRAIDNCQISSLRAPKLFIQALGLIKQSAAQTNESLGLLSSNRAKAIVKAAQELIDGKHDTQFPVDIFQTGSGTSLNMNANEIISHLATNYANETVHPNDHVNMSQSSNDTIPTAIHVSAMLALHQELIPKTQYLIKTLEEKEEATKDITTTGRTHLMDAMPVTISQIISGWTQQLKDNLARIDDAQNRLHLLAQGGTAVGTGINAHPKFGRLFAKTLSKITKLPFQASDNYFRSLSCQDTAVELSGHLRTFAVSYMKIANDLRWMNSGPLAGIGEITLKALQPGSSIMPGKINPIIPEAVCMVAAQVMGNDTTITVSGQAGNFQLNVMLPVIAYNLLESIEILSNSAQMLAEHAIKDFQINIDHIKEKLDKNPILVTALNGVIGYEQGAKIAKAAYKQGRPIIEVAQEMTDLSQEELEKLLDPKDLTTGGIKQ